MTAFARELPLAAKVQVIAHRGASALRPEHTLAAYVKAIEDGADFIEPDLVVTRDGVLVARHENEISGTTDVAAHPEFAARRTNKQTDGVTVSGWFAEDFTLVELKTLRARERLPELRSTAYDGQFEIPTLDEIIKCVALASKACGRIVGIIPEIKHSTYFMQQGLPLEDRLLDVLAAHAYTQSAPIEIQSFEITNLRYLRGKLETQSSRTGHSNIRLLQLLDAADQQPYDVADSGGKLTYGQMCQPAGLKQVATYADAIGPERRAIVPLNADGDFAAPTALVRDAHAVGLEVHPYTFRPENIFLPLSLRCGADPQSVNAAGCIADIRACLDAGIDAFFTDAPALGRRALERR
ncbi:MAG: glycerophosphodiester phosphodiesterase [Rhodanobacter sp.]